MAHGTGRLILEREGYPVDWERLFQTAAANGKAIEINANYRRLDLDDIRAHQASRLGIPIVINTDMHRRRNFDQMRFGVGVARRGWLTRGHVLNTRSWKDLEAWRRRARGGLVAAASPAGPRRKA